MNINSYVKLAPFIFKLLCNVVLLTLLSSKVYAGCPIVAHVTGPATLSVNPSLPVGTVLATITLSWGSTPSTCTLNTPTGTAQYEFKGEGVPDGHLYPTSILGISYDGRLPGWSYQGLDGYWPVSKPYSYFGGSTISAGNTIIEFVKTGQVTLGQPFGPGLIMEGTINGLSWFNIYLDNSITIIPTVPACTITQSVIPVTLATASSNDLKTTGNTAESTAFNIPIKCDTEADIGLSFSGTVADSANGVFKSSDAETADKVGIQLLDKNSTPVPTDADHSVPVGKINGPYNYPMTARYYTLAPGVTAGKVSSVVNATIIYN